MCICVCVSKIGVLVCIVFLFSERGLLRLSENERREEKSLAHAFLFRAGTTFVVKKLNGH